MIEGELVMFILLIMFLVVVCGPLLVTIYEKYN